MTTFLKTSWFFIVLLVALPSLTSCGEIPLGEYRIEWDKHDPRLHGQVVHFKVPMSYVLLEEKHIGDYPKEDVAIGKILTTEEDVFMPGGYAKMGHLSQQVKDGLAFTIKATYWYRRDRLNQELFGDMRRLVLVDENGIESIMLFYKFNISDRPELFNLREEGRFK